MTFQKFDWKIFNQLFVNEKKNGDVFDYFPKKGLQKTQFALIGVFCSNRQFHCLKAPN